MHNLGQASFGHWIAWSLIGGVAYVAWKYDEWRHENGWVDYNQSDVSPIIPDPQAVVAENADKQEESEDDKP